MRGKLKVFICDNVLRDPGRPVLDHWLRIPLDGTRMLKLNNTNADAAASRDEVTSDLELAPGVVLGGSPFKVRVLRSQKIGSVLSLIAAEYFLAKGEAAMPGYSNCPRYEPVPDSVELRSL